MKDKLPRRLGIWSLTALTVGLIIGSGIFQTPAVVATAAGPVWAILLVWFAGGAITLCLALCVAELGTMYPHAGGLYVYLREAFGSAVAFVYGWTFLLVNPASWAAISLVLAQYLASLLRLPPSVAAHVATAAIAIACALNCFSVPLVAFLQKMITPAKTIALIAMVLAIFWLGHSGSHGAFRDGGHTQVPTLGALGIAIAAVLWPYDGVASASSAYGEVTQPQSTIPRALIVSITTITLLYLLVNAAFLYALPLNRVATSNLVASDAMAAVGTPAATAIISACAVLATAGALIATSMTDPRVFYAMANDGLFFNVVGRVHPRFKTPHVAVVVSGILAILYVEVRTFEQLAVGYILGIWLFYGLSVAGLMRLRRFHPRAHRPYRVMPYPLIPLMFIAGTAVLIIVALTQQPLLVLFDILISASGFPVYYVWLVSKRRAQERAGPGVMGA